MQAFVKSVRHTAQAVYSVLHYTINAHLRLLFVFFRTQFVSDRCFHRFILLLESIS